MMLKTSGCINGITNCCIFYLGLKSYVSKKRYNGMAKYKFPVVYLQKEKERNFEV